MIDQSVEKLEARQSIKFVGIIGAGAMGRGIAQLCLTSGVSVILADVNLKACEEAKEFIASMLKKLYTKGKLTEDQYVFAKNGLMIESIEAIEAFKGTDLVIEAVVERIDVKQSLFQQLEQVVSEKTILASNTSSLSITDIASQVNSPERVAGLHFFNPVPLMKVVEVIRGQLTSETVVEKLVAFTHALGHAPIEVQDMPGFLINHAGRGYGTEALAILSEGVADVATIDYILKKQCGFKMGPFELFDLTGLDVSHTVTESIFQQFYAEPRYRPSAIADRRMKAGLYGRKVGRGFYDYAEGAEKPAPKLLNPQRPEQLFPVWLDESLDDIKAQLTASLESVGITVETGANPSSEALCLISPNGEDATHYAFSKQLELAHVVAIDTSMGLDNIRVLMSTVCTVQAYIELAGYIFGLDDVDVVCIGDSPGFIAQRVLAVIVNIACEIANQSISSPTDIDTAITLGLGYPHGPLDWGNQLDSKVLLHRLDNIHRRTRDARYRPSLWLQRRANAGLSLLYATQHAN